MSEDRSTAPWDAWRAAEAEVVALRAQVEELTRERDMLAKGIKAQDGELLRRVRQAEARLAAVVQWLNVVLDETDYTAKACAPTEMVGAVLSREVIQSARAALAAAREQDAITAGLDCPCCGEDVLLRVEPIWYEDESEACSDCGCTVGVRVDDDEGLPTAYTKVTKGCADYGDADD